MPTPPTPGLDPAHALAQHDALRAQVISDRAPLDRTVYPLALFGGLTLLSAIVAAVTTPSGYALYWAIAGPLGGASIGIHYGRLEHRLALRRSGTGIAIAVAAVLVLAATLLGAAAQSSTAPFLAVAAGLAVFGVLWQSLPTLLASSLTALVTAVVALTDPAGPNVILGVAIGAVLLACAALDRAIGARAA